MSTKKTYLLRKTSIGLVSLAALAVVGSTVSANEIGVATAHGTGAYADPIPTFNINTGELTAKGSGVLNSDYKPALDPSTVDIFVKGGENGVATTTELPEVKVAFENGEPYVYAHGTGVTATVELPALDPSTVDITKNGEGVTAPALNEATLALDENGLYLVNTPVAAPTAEALPTVQVGGKDGDFYLYAKGASTTVAELPTIDPATLGAPIETAKGESVTAPALPAAELPALETAKGEGVTAEELPAVEVSKDENGEYLSSKGTGTTAAELPVAELPALETAKGEGVTAEELPAVEVSKDENGEYLSSKGTGTTAAELPVAELPALETAKGEGVTAPELPAIDPATLKETPAEKEETKSEEVPAAAPKAAASKAAAASSAKLPETGESSSAVYFVTALGLLGAAVVAKRKEN